VGRCPSRMSIVALCLTLLWAPPTVEASSEAIDADAVRDGLVMRLSERADDWAVRVGPVTDGRGIVSMSAPDGWVLTREVRIDAGDPTTRGRQLASSIAVVIENYEPRASPPPPDKTPPPDKAPPPDKSAEAKTPLGPSGWIAAGALLSSGPAGRADVAAGVDLAGGFWFAREHVMPYLSLGWRRATAGDLTVDAAHAAVGMAFGTPLGQGHIWVGGGLVAGAIGGFARDADSASGWGAQLGTPAMLVARAGRFFGSVHAGPQVALPPLHFRGQTDSLRWGHVRVAAGLRLGLRFGSS